MAMRRVLALVLIGTGLAACGEEEAVKPVERIRAIKYVELGALAEGQERRLAGVVKAGTQSNVAFEIGGRVVVMAVDPGDPVKEGELLARLDPKPYELQLEQAEFSLKQAQATLEDSESKFKQQDALWKRGYATRTAYDTATTNLENARGQVGIAQSQLGLRRRDLEKTELIAPFDGVVASKLVEVFEEISPGLAIYTVQTTDTFEVEVSVPENILGQVEIGAEVGVAFSPLANGGTPPTATGVISEIAPLSGDVNAYPIKIRLLDPPPGVRSGMSAEITLKFETQGEATAFAVPLTTLKPDLRQQVVPGAPQLTGIVFVYDAEDEVVREKPVQVIGIQGNTPQIVGDLKAGDILATAGVDNMHDGMRVRLLDPTELR